MKSEEKPIDAATAFHLGSSKAIQNVLTEVEKEAQTRVKKGFNERNFTLGVLNSLIIIYTFGGFPQHFWILYIAEAMILIPLKFNEMRSLKPLNGAYYVLDYCWAMNFVGVFALILLALTGESGLFPTSEQFHKNLFLASFGVACGPLLGAAGALPFVALVFHDLGTMCDLFIHIFPPMLMYTMRWKSGEILQAWPSIFDLNYDVTFFPNTETKSKFSLGSLGIGTVFGNAMMLYAIWLIPYFWWILKIGMNLPSVGYNTVFHSTMRNGMCILLGNLIWNRPVEKSKRQMETNNFDRRNLYLYLFMHFLATILATAVLAYLCYKSKQVHGFLLIALGLLTIWRGAQRYHYYSTELYVKIIKRMAEEPKFNANVNANVNVGGLNEKTPLLQT